MNKQIIKFETSKLLVNSSKTKENAAVVSQNNKTNKDSRMKKMCEP